KLMRRFPRPVPQCRCRRFSTTIYRSDAALTSSRLRHAAGFPMTTTVRILGSRAREQVPGTGMTLLAPGFRGALTQFAAGDSPTTEHDLPFAESAAGADVLLAAQLTLSIEARPALAVGLRSRSAVAAHPRVI